MRKFTFYFTLLLLLPFYSWAQIDLCLPLAAAKGGAVTAEVKDWEAIGINPANLGYESNHKFSVTILNIGLSAQSSALDVNTLKAALFHPGDTFSMAQKQHFANVFSNTDGLNLYGDINWVAFSLYFPKIGGFALNLRDRIIAHLTLSPTCADVLFNGWNSAIYKDSSALKEDISQALNGTNFAYYHYRELNLDYGRKLFQIGGTKETSSQMGGASATDKAKSDDMDPNALEVYGGIGLKYLWGLANVYAEAANGGIDAHSAISNIYQINYGNIPNFTPTAANNLFDNTGHGVAADIGISGAYKKWRFGIAATDLGSILWQHNTLTAVDTLMPRLASNNNGIDSWSQIGNFALSDNSILNFKPGPDYRLALPAKLRTGVSYEVIKQITISADAVFPLNTVIGNLENPYYALAGQFDIVKGISISLGFAGNQVYGFDMPLGLSLGLKNILEFYVGTADILTWLNITKNPNISACVGLLRFNL